MTTKLTWQTETPTEITHAIVIVKSDIDPNFITIAEYDTEHETWFETGGLNLQLGNDRVIRWAELKQLAKLLKE